VADYVTAIWRCRYFWLSLVKMDLETRYRRSLLGLGWSLLHPIVLTITLYIVFRGVFAGDASSYALEVLTGLVLWNYVTGVSAQGCQCFLVAETYIRQHPSPLAIFPLRTALGAMVHFWLAMAVVLAATGLLAGFHNVSVLLSLAGSTVLLFGLAWSLALLTGIANVIFRDTEHLLQVSFQILFYGTPIIYPERVLDSFPAGWLLKLNPLVPFLRLFREPILRGELPSWKAYAAAAAGVAVLAGSAILVLRSLQRRLIYYL
jgi:ABC-type polysaccharide/polyol phosphate export permease